MTRKIVRSLFSLFFLLIASGYSYSQPRSMGSLVREAQGRARYQPLEKGWHHVDMGDRARFSFDTARVRSDRISEAKRRDFSKHAKKSIIGMEMTIEPRAPSHKDYPAPRQRMDVKGSVYHFEPEGLEFDAPAVVTLPYSLAGSEKDADVNVYYYNKATKYWELIPAIARDTANKTITACISHFSDYVAGTSSFTIDESGTLGGGNTVQDVDPYTGSLILKTTEFNIPARGVPLTLTARFNSDYIYRSKGVPDYSATQANNKIFVPAPNGNYSLPYTDISSGWTYELPFIQYGAQNQFSVTLPGGKKLQFDSLLPAFGSIGKGSAVDYALCRVTRSTDGSKLYIFCPESRVSIEASCSFQYYSYYVETGPSEGYQVTGYNGKITGNVLLRFADGSNASFKSSGFIDKLSDASGKNCITYSYDAGDRLSAISHIDGRSVRIYSFAYDGVKLGKKAIFYVLSDSSDPKTLGKNDEFLARRVLNADGTTESYSVLTTIKQSGETTGFSADTIKTNETKYYTAQKTTDFTYLLSSAVSGNTITISDPGLGFRKYVFTPLFFKYAVYLQATYESAGDGYGGYNNTITKYNYLKPKVSQMHTCVDKSFTSYKKTEYAYTQGSCPEAPTSWDYSEASFWVRGDVAINPISVSVLESNVVDGASKPAVRSEIIEYAHDDKYVYQGIGKDSINYWNSGAWKLLSETRRVFSKLPYALNSCIFEGYYPSTETCFVDTLDQEKWKITYVYDCFGRLTASTDSRKDPTTAARTIEYISPTSEIGSGLNLKFGLVKQESVLKESSLYLSTNYEYDAALNLLRKTVKDKSFGNASFFDRITKFEYDTPTNVLKKITYPNGNVLELSYGAKPKSSFITQDKRCLGTVNIIGTAEEWIFNDFEYDLRGRTTKVTTKLANSSGTAVTIEGKNPFPVASYEYTYDGCNRVTSKSRKATDSTTTLYNRVYDDDNLKVTTTNAKGYRNVESFDSFYRRIESKSYRPDSAGQGASYSGTGQVAVSSGSWKYDIIYPHNILEGRTFTDKSDATVYNFTTYSYDDAGRLKTLSAGTNGGTNPISSVKLRELEYSFSQDGSTVAEKNYRNANDYTKTDTLSDWLGQTRTVTTYSEVKGSGTPLKTSYTYDYFGNRLSQTLQNGEVYTYDYSLSGLLEAITYPASRGKHQNEYDLGGLLTKSIDVGGNVTELLYNKAGMLIEKKATKNGKNAITVSTTYCQYGPYKITQKNGSGANPEMVISYEYGENGLVKKEERSIYVGDAKYDSSVQRTYYADGNLSSLDVKGFSGFSRVFKYSLPHFGGINSAPDGTTRISVDDAVIGRLSSTYAGQKDKLYYGSGGITSFSDYDFLLRPKSIDNPADGQNNYCDFTYDYDYSGNVTSWTQSAVLGSYSYDGMNRLKTNNGSYTYDSIGNITKTPENTSYAYIKTSTFANAPSSMRLESYKSSSTIAVVDDKNLGNIVSISGRFSKLSYDAFNRLISITDDARSGGAQTDAYSYDPFGLRYKKEENTAGADKATTCYLYEGNSILAEERIQNGAWSDCRINAYLGAMNIGQYKKTPSAQNLVYFYLDHLGSVRMVVDSQGKSLAKINYSLWGVVKTDDVKNYDGNDNTSYISFTGKKRDLTGLYYFNARYYDPSMGRFFTEDPMRDGMNWYAYCGNNPVSFTDPDGLMVDKEQGENPYIAHDQDGNIIGRYGKDDSIFDQDSRSSGSASVPPKTTKESDYLRPIGPDTKKDYHCDQMASYRAYLNGRDPRTDQGKPINFDRDNVSTIFGQFSKNNKHSSPLDDSGGFVFTYPDGKGGFKHVEAYEKSAAGLTVWETNGMVPDPPVATSLLVTNLASRYDGATWVPRTTR